MTLRRWERREKISPGSASSQSSVQFPAQGDKTVASMLS
jgi:hypothetical protein